jgi:uncharacterized protein (DUF1810 family)
MAVVAEDAFNLRRFVDAQSHDFAQALEEIRRGRKESHWMWYVFPQVRGLGQSATSRLYAISGLDEARAYLDHPVLGPRLLQCASTLVDLDGRSASAIFGSPDDLKLRSSATLFSLVSPHGSVFHRVLDKFFEGRPDPRTVEALAS